MTFIVRGRNTPFICEHCGANVPKAKSTVRDHCNQCLYSKHVDIAPGDRAETCNGLMEPVCYIVKRDKIIIKYKCIKCGYIHYNKAAKDDNVDTILNLPLCQERF